MIRRALAISAALALGDTIEAQVSSPESWVIDQKSYSAGVKQLKDSRTYILPTVTLHLSHHGSMSARAAGGKGSSATAKAAYVVDGMDKALVQGLAALIQDDLATKLRAAGFNVLTYADIKDHQSLANREREKADDDVGLPTSKDPSGKLVFAVANPSDAQAFSTGRGWSPRLYKDVAKDKDAVVIWPEIWFDMPRLTAEKRRGYRSASASIEVDPGIDLRYFMVNIMNAKQGGGAILAKHPMEVSEAVGAVDQLKETKTTIARNIGRKRGDYELTLDPGKFRAAVLKAGFAINDVIVSQAREAHRM